MIIKIPETINKEVEINLPYYSKNYCFAYKVISEELVIHVNFKGSYRAIEQRNVRSCEPFAEDAIKITEEEFWLLYNETKDKLYELAISG
jgi:hypothetical protein